MSRTNLYRTITDIKLQKRNSKRVSLFLDGKFYQGLDKEVVVALGLKKEQKVSLKQLEEVVFEGERKRAKDKILRLLEFRPRGIREIETRLKKDKFDAKVINQAIADIKKIGYLDDQAFVQAWIRDRLAKGYGRRRVASELLAKGVAKELIETELACLDEEDELALALSLAEKKFSSVQGLDDSTCSPLADAAGDDRRATLRRLNDYLLRRGFSYSTVNEALRRLTKDADLD